jgi:hypothetical protein
MKLFLLLTLLTATALSAADVATGEWFLDGDPGVGQGTAFPIATASTANESVAIPASALQPLEPGVHLLGVRLRDDEGAWGHTLWRTFLKDDIPTPTPALTGGEWFLDSDPGIGGGTAFAASPGPVALALPASALDALEPGVHLLGVRLTDEAGRWGHTLWRTFLKDTLPLVPPALASLDYRILRNGEVVASGSRAAAAPTDELAFTFTHGADGLVLGERHILEVTAIDTTGRRGHAVHVPFDYLRYGPAWLRRHFTEDERDRPSISGDDADPDEDGLDNATERAFALNPRDASDRAAASPAIVRTGESFTLTFRVPAGGSVDTAGVYRTSNLVYHLREGISPATTAIAPADWLQSSALTPLEPSDDGAARLQLTLLPPSAPKRFFQLEGSPAETSP